MKKILLVIPALFLIAFPKTTFAAQETCVTQYGGGVVCGASTPEVPHQPVNAGLAENLALVGISLLISSIALYIYSNKKFVA